MTEALEGLNLRELMDPQNQRKQAKYANHQQSILDAYKHASGMAVGTGATVEDFVEFARTLAHELNLDLDLATDKYFDAKEARNGANKTPAP